MRHFEDNPFLSVATITSQYKRFIDTRLREDIVRRCIAQAAEFAVQADMPGVCSLDSDLSPDEQLAS